MNVALEHPTHTQVEFLELSKLANYGWNRVAFAIRPVHAHCAVVEGLPEVEPLEASELGEGVRQGEDGCDGFLWGKKLIQAEPVPEALRSTLDVASVAEGAEGTTAEAAMPERRGEIIFQGADEGDDQLAAGDRFVYRLQKPFKRSDLMNVLSRALAERFTVRIDDKDDEQTVEPSEVYRKAS